MLFCNLNCFSQEGYNPIYVSLDKIGCISTKKIKVFGLLFCFVFDLNKNLTLKKDNCKHPTPILVV